MKKLMIWAFKSGAVCLAALVLFGFAGGVHPALDSLSLLRLPLAVACLLLLVFPMGLRLRVWLAAAAVAGLATTVPLFFGGGGQDELRIYSKNLWYRNPDLSALTADIRDSGADVVTLQEVSQRNRALMDALNPQYPYQHICTNSGWSGVAVLSRDPIIDVTCTDRRAVAAARVDRADGPVWVVSVHLSWPYPYGNGITAQSAIDVLDDLEGPVVMAGDFNIFPWADSVKGMQHAASLQMALPIRPTYNLEGVPLLLDHVHAPGGGTVTYRGLLGSDHIGVLADVSLRP